MANGSIALIATGIGTIQSTGERVGDQAVGDTIIADGDTRDFRRRSPRNAFLDRHLARQESQNVCLERIMTAPTQQRRLNRNGDLTRYE
jgi:hypothetical protein